MLESSSISDILKQKQGNPSQVGQTSDTEIGEVLTRENSHRIHK